MSKFKNIKAVITGAASGLGFATAEKITRGGGKVAIIDIDQERGEKALYQLGAGSSALFCKTDVTQETAVDEAIATTVDTFGNINLCVNCAGIAPSQRVLGKQGLMSAQQFLNVININLLSTFNVIRAVSNEMQHNDPDENEQRGVIINTASIAAYDGQIGQCAYAASKGGIVSMTLPLAREFARIGIRVMTIAPGLFKTPIIDTLPEKAVNALADSIPFPHRLGDPAEFASTVLHIVRNPMLNGETIRLDGALRM